MEAETIMNEVTQTINPITGRDYRSLSRPFSDERNKFIFKERAIIECPGGSDGPRSILEIQKYLGRMDVRTGKVDIQDYYSFISEIYDFVEETFVMNGDGLGRFVPEQIYPSYIAIDR